MIPDYYNSLGNNSIEDIATKMRVLANYIGGDHVTNKEAEFMTLYQLIWRIINLLIYELDAMVRS